MARTNVKLAEQVAQLNLPRRASFTQKLFKYGFRDAAILFVGGAALVTLGLVTWWIGAQWLVDWLDSLATRPDKRVGWVGFPLQALLTVVELALMLKLKDNPKVAATLALSVLIDAGTNSAGTLNFLTELILGGKLSTITSFPALWLITTPLVAFLTYGPEKLMTWGAELFLEGWYQLVLVFQTARLAVEKEREETEKKAGAGPQRNGWSVVRGKGEK